MKKDYFLLMFAMICLAASDSYRSNAQQMTPCYEDQERAKLIARHPEIIQIEAKLNAEIEEKLKGIDYSKAARTTGTDETGNDTFWYDIPIVIHIIHDYGAENLSDNDIINYLAGWNIVYAKQNADTSNVIPTYAGFIPGTTVPYIGNPHIRLHLATIDPNGNPTKGITRHRSYLTYLGSDQAKLDDWPPTSYVNIWSVNLIPASGGFQAAAYALQPPAASAEPNSDGVISDYLYMPDDFSLASGEQVGKTINHEMGHVFYLIHPWANTNFPQVAVGSDLVDDTPPTWGHNPVGCQFDLPSSNDNSIYDSFGATNYYVIYPTAGGGDSIVNYPDTTNTQNIMDYTYCSRMFTYGQCARMHAALNSDVAGRNNLWNPVNLANTGALAPLPDFKPIPDFFASIVASPAALSNNNQVNYMGRVNSFTIPNVPVQFNNESWDDTVTGMQWTFTDGGGATQTSDSLTYVKVKFANSGWVNLSLQASGNHTGDSTIDFPRAVYVADTTATPAEGYVQEFSGGDTAQWPMFNYYNNEFKWQMANVGYDDNSSVEYVGFDSRIDLSAGIFPHTGAPGGDFDDLFSVPFDLSSFGSNPCYLNFYYSGATRANLDYDEMDIAYAYRTAAGMSTWTTLTKMKATLDNMGEDSAAYTPASQGNWAAAGFELPPAAKTAYTVFRFRYLPGNNPSTALLVGDTLSGGNNFYLDKLSFSPFPAAVNNVNLGNVGVAVVPNPTSGDAFVVVKDADNTIARVTVMDITGKVVFTTSQQVMGNEAKIQIPHSAIAVPGMYIVQTTTGNQAHTQKLVVE